MYGKRHSRGFTLIELLVVIAIIGILASVVLASLDSGRKKSRNASYLAQIKQYQNALELYYLNSGSYPGGGGWACIGIGHQNARCWNNNAYAESTASSIAFRSSMAAYINSDTRAGPQSGTFTGAMYRRPSASQYILLILLEGDLACPFGTKVGVYGGYTRCDYTHNN